MKYWCVEHGEFSARSAGASVRYVDDRMTALTAEACLVNGQLLITERNANGHVSQRIMQPGETYYIKVRERTPLETYAELHPPPVFNRDCDRDDLREIWNFWNYATTLDKLMEFRAFLLSRGLVTDRAPRA